MNPNSLRVELVVSLGTQPERFEISELPATIGRGPCAIQIDDQSVSREHCRLEIDGGKLVLVDLESANGTWFDNKRVRKLAVSTGAALKVGTVPVVVEKVTIRRAKEPDPLVGKRLGGYQIERVLGRGGTGTVYHAHQIRLDREVAVKVLETKGDDSEIAAFEEEARAAAALDSPRLVRVFDIGEIEGRHFFAMELVPGGNLAAHIKRSGPFSWRDTIRLTIEVLEALALAHERGFVHGDVKPANVLLTSEGHAKLADLGLVRRAETSGTQAAGTIAYIAPETLRRDPVDARADFYSLGCTMFTMLTGKRVFEEASSKQIAAAHLKKAPPTLASAGAEAPHQLQLILDELLAKDPADRPERATDIIAALREVRAEPDVKRTGRRARRRVTRQAGPGASHAVLYVLLLIAVVAFAIWLAQRKPD